MSWYVYMIKSQKNGFLYKGVTQDPERRLQEHNGGRNKSTSALRPWEMVFLEPHPDQSSALAREKQLKRQNRNYLDSLILNAKLAARRSKR